jgi:hypothetical protein
MPAKLTQEQWIEKARKVHGSKYDYSKVLYLHSNLPVIIICPVHGEFEQAAYSHVRGDGCKKCGYEFSANSRSGGLELFLLKAREKFGTKFNYSKTKLLKLEDTIIVSCPDHGDFYTTG